MMITLEQVVGLLGIAIAATAPITAAIITKGVRNNTRKDNDIFVREITCKAREESMLRELTKIGNNLEALRNDLVNGRL